MGDTEVTGRRSCLEELQSVMRISLEEDCMREKMQHATYRSIEYARR
jgi:hypothetical protein